MKAPEAVGDDRDLIVERIVAAVERRLTAIELDLIELRKKGVADGESEVCAEHRPEDVAGIFGNGRVRAVAAELEPSADLSALIPASNWTFVASQSLMKS